MPAGTQVASLFGVLSLDDKDFKRGVEGAETKMQGLAGSLGGMVGGIGKAAAMGATAIVGATAAIGVGMFELAKDAAPIEGIRKAFEGIATASGKSADETLKALADSSKGMISNTELMKSYNSAAQLVSTEFANQLPDAMQYLTKVAAATGQDMGFMMESLVKGVGRASPLILDNLGIQVNLTEATEEYAKKVGKSADQLSKAEVQTAIMNKTLEQLKKNTASMPDITDNAATKWGAFQTRLANFKDDVGVKLLPFFEQVIGFLMQLADQVLPIVMPIVEKLAGAFGTFFDALSDGVDPIESIAMAIFRVFGQSSRPLVDFLKTVGDGFEAIIRGIGFFISDLQDMGLVDAILEAFGVKSGESWLEWVLVSFGMARETAHNAVTTIGNFLQGLVSFISSTVIPGIQRFIDIIAGIVTGIQTFVANNPAFMTALAFIGGAVLVLVGIMTAVPIILGLISSAVGVLTGALGVLLSPAVLLAGAIAGIVYAADKLYPGGLAQLFSDATKSAQQLAILGFGALMLASNWARDRLVELLNTILNVISKIDELKNRLSQGVTGVSGIAGGLASGQFNLGQVIQATVNEFKPKAGGGSVMGGGAYIVGEQGPELFTPSVSGNISTASETAGMMGGVNIGTLIINANDRAGGEAAMDGALNRARAQGY